MKTEDFSTEERELAAKTSRSAGTVGENSLVIKYVTSILKKGEKVLNFGAGKVNKDGKIPHSERLEHAGAIVTNYDFPENFVKGVHDPTALNKKYRIVIASNVLNVQLSEEMLDKTIVQLVKVTGEGILVANYPRDPRKTDLSPEDIRTKLREYFEKVTIVDGGVKTPVYRAVRKK